MENLFLKNYLLFPLLWMLIGLNHIRIQSRGHIFNPYELTLLHPIQKRISTIGITHPWTEQT